MFARMKKTHKMLPEQASDNFVTFQTENGNFV